MIQVFKIPDPLFEISDQGSVPTMMYFIQDQSV